MATTTTNYNLVKPAGTDMASPTPFNDNMDILDAALKAVSDKADIQEVFFATYGTTTFAEIQAAYAANLEIVLNYPAQYVYCLFGAFNVDNNVRIGCYFTGIRKTNSVVRPQVIKVQLTSENIWSETIYDLALKDYVDESFLPLSGGTMTGALLLPGAPTANLQASTKKYVDDGLAAKSGLPKAFVYVSLNFASSDTINLISCVTVLGHSVTPAKVVAIPLHENIAVEIQSSQIKFTRSTSGTALTTGAIIIEFN